MTETKLERRTTEAAKRGKRLLEEQRNYPVAMHNEFIQGRRYTLPNAGKSMTITETKILMYLVSRIKKEDTQLEPQEFNLRNFCEVCGIGGDSTSDYYAHLKQAIKKLADRSSWLKTEDGKEKLVRIISKAELNTAGTGTIRIILDNDMAPYLLELKRNYTVFPLKEVLRMKSKYGIALYEILKSYAFTGRPVEFSLQDLKERLDCTSYSSTYNLKVKVLEPALRDINTYSSLKVDVEYEKVGRSISSVVFFVTDLATSVDVLDEFELNHRYRNSEKEFFENQQLNMFDEMLSGPEDDSVLVAG